MSRLRLDRLQGDAGATPKGPNEEDCGGARRANRGKEVNHKKESILNNIAKVIDDRRISTPSCCPTASTPETLRSVS